MQSKILYIGFFLLLATLAAAQCPGPAQRTALINLQRAIEVESTRAGQIPLSDTCGNQRYAQYVEVNLDTIAYTPTPTGNVANLSEFVIDPTGAIFYIDWQGNSIEFAGGGSSCDVDWLQISDNSCPDAITDSIYHQRYASVGARLVWPGAEFLVNDSTTSAILVVQGSRNARGAYYDSNAGTFSMFDHGGTTPTFLFPNAGVFTFKTTGGTPQSPGGTQIEHFSIRAQDSLIRMNMYPNTRVDVTAISNFLYTDVSGNVRSNTPAALVAAAGGLIAQPAKRIVYGTGPSVTSSRNFVYDSISGVVTTRLTNNVVTSTANAVQKITAVAGGGDPQLQIGIGDSVTNSYYYLGIDNSASDNLFLARTTSGQAVGSGNLYWQAQSGGTQILYYTPSNLPAVVIATDNTTIGTGNESIQVAPDVITLVAQSGADISNIQLSPTALDIGVDGALQVTAATTDFKYAGGNPQIDGGVTSIDLYSDDGTGFITVGNTSVGLASGNNDISLDEASQQISIYAPLGLNLQAPGGNVIIGGGAAASEIRMYEPVGGGSNVTGWVAGTMAADYGPYIMPVDAPADGEVLAWGTGNQLRWDPSGAACPTCFVNGGNSFAGTATLGTNDANTLALETNNITRATLNTSGVWNVTDETATTNTVVVREQIGNNSSGTPSTGFGTRTEYLAESSTTTGRLQGAIQTRWSTATDASRASEMDFITVNSGSEITAVTIEANGDVGIGTANPAHPLSNTSIQVTDGTGVSTAFGFGWRASVSTANYLSGFLNTSTSSTAHGLLVGANATDNATRALTVSVGSGPTRVFNVNCDQKVGILDETPEVELDVTGTTATNHLTGQNLTPTITVNTAVAGTGATASIVNAQSSDLAIRFSITSGTGAVAGLWATITFDDAFSITPIFVVQAEGTNTGPAIDTSWSVTCSTTTAEFYLKNLPASPDSKTYEYSGILIGGK